MRARAGILLEVMVALAIFVSAGLAILGLMDRAAAALESGRLAQSGAEMTRSAMARIEAGLATPETLHGPVQPPVDDIEIDPGTSDESARAGWELEITTEPSSFDGLTKVSIAALRVSPGAGSPVRTMYTLRQLVRLSPSAEDTPGEKDDVTKAAERGDRRGGRP